ncbi:hypothetical protein JF50_21680 [Pseudoalteromonas luteoviolacea]|uniref:Uncharacterized protein n=1 Tax=Pseudoalteromonas luteoviolacea TaxID=43657 RepID=A0A0C1MCP0_9GAMM|nr:hypothetical protein [Pseudoalteromonas luteoviolacea]KID54544.1 hypothetical protein JF50_21680 [Pseudoalteromonas luteoviolacea]
MQFKKIFSGMLLTLAVANAISVQAAPGDIIRPPVEPCAYGADPVLLSAQEQTLNGAELAESDFMSMFSGRSIYIGGERHSLTQSDFSVRTVTETYYCPGLEPLVVQRAVGLDLSLPVYNDFGQKLYFDIAGRASRNMQMSASCGTFSASDSGDKFYVSQGAVTGGSCDQLNLSFDFSRYYTTPSLSLSVMISEEL